MRSRGRVATPQWSPDKSAEADESSHFGPIEIFWVRHYHREGTRQVRVHHDLSVRLLIAARGSPLAKLSVPVKERPGPWGKPEMF
jgi:hypothetical protein